MIAIVGSLLCISPIFGKEELQCKSNQECIKLRDCPYTKKLLTRVLSSSDGEETNNMIAEMRKLVCNPLDTSVCCNKVESEAEDEAKGDHEEFDAKAEGDLEASKPEAEDDHEDSDPKAEGGHKESYPEAEGDLEESDPEAEAEGDHEESEAEAEDDHEESEPEASGDYYYDSEVEAEGDPEESEAVAEGSDYNDQNKIMDTLGKFIAYEKLIS